MANLIFYFVSQHVLGDVVAHFSVHRRFVLQESLSLLDHPFVERREIAAIDLGEPLDHGRGQRPDVP
jgi:hypothetical protein